MDREEEVSKEGKLLEMRALALRAAFAMKHAIEAWDARMDAIGAVLGLPEGAGTTTIESKTNFLGGAPVGAEITAEATPIYRGRRTSVWQTRITNEAGKLLALVTQTQMTI